MPALTMKVPSASLAAMPKLLHQHQHHLNHILSATTTRLLLLLLVLFSCMLDFTCSERDFNFNDSQVPLLEPKDEPKHARQNLHPYVAELSRCHYADSEIILSLVLQDHDWNTVNLNKKSKVLAKLAKFFAIPKEFIMLESVGKHEMNVMQKESLRKGNNKCHKQRQLGRASFVLGCGSTYFSMAEPIVNQIGQQMKDGSIDNITGERFGWWVIWHRSVEVRAHRSRREATEGSGEDEYDDSYDYDQDEEENTEAITEIPVIQQQHAHRHHHGDVSEPDLNESKFVDAQIGVDEAINSNAVPKSVEASETILNKAASANIDEEIVKSVSQLESVISKTIENTKHIKDVVMMPTSDVSSPVADIEKELESTRILEEIQNELSRKNDEGNALASTTTAQTTKNIAFETQSPSSSTTTTTVIPNVDSNNANYDDNLDAVDDFDDLDTDAVYELPTNRNSIDSVMPPAVDVVAEVIESSTILTPVTKENETTAHINSISTATTSTASASATPFSFVVTPSPTQTQSPLDTQPAMIVTTTITPLSQMPPLQSPESPIYDTPTLLHSNKPSFSSSSSSSVSSSSSSSSTPSLLPSSIASTMTPLMFSSSSSSSSSIYDVTMIPSSTPSPFQAILTTTEQNKQRNDFIEETQTIHPSINSEDHNLIEYTTTATTITTMIIPTFINETTTRIAFDETPLLTTQSTTMKSTSTATTPNDIYDANNGLKAKENENSATSSVGTDPLPNVTFLSTPTLSTPTSDLVTTPVISTLSTSALPELTTPTSPSTDYVEPHIENTPPIIKTRLPKINVIAGKYFVSPVPENIFYDNEDQTNLRLEFTDKEGREVKRTSWIQFNSDTREIYGLPVFDTVAKYFYHLRATDSGNETVTETVEIKVQQHRYERSFNHEINITVKINEKSMPSVDWQIKLIKGVADTLGDESTDAIVVREIPQMRLDPNTATFAYFNETFSTSICPEMELNDVVRRLDASRLTDFVQPMLGIKSITGQLIGTCRKIDMTPTKPPAIITKNLPPVPRNQVDRVNATVGHLLVFPVPIDTFYDANDNHLTLTLKTKEHKEISPRHWLQFDSKNEEFYGIPKSADIGSEEYLLVAEDSGGLTATDALVVVVSHAPKREFSVYFKAYLAIRHEQFNAHLQRKFVESISELFGDKGTHYVQIRSVTTHHDSDGTIVNFYNTTLFKSHNRCPEEEIEAARSIYLMSDNTVRERVKKTLGPDLNLTNVQVIPLGACHPQTDITHREFIPPKNDEPLLKSTFADDYFYTFILPAAIIVIMILVALIIACCLHRRRRKSGKMELGDEEERKSFRTKGIPVIFQDELDEKPEIGNKSPIILKDEKPPLLPPSYNTSNMNGDNDVDEYVPPPAVVMGGREARGKSPATPSYRKPPPYVSP